MTITHTYRKAWLVVLSNPQTEISAHCQRLWRAAVNKQAPNDGIDGGSVTMLQISRVTNSLSPFGRWCLLVQERHALRGWQQSSWNVRVRIMEQILGTREWSTGTKQKVVLPWEAASIRNLSCVCRSTSCSCIILVMGTQSCCKAACWLSNAIKSWEISFETMSNCCCRLCISASTKH